MTEKAMKQVLKQASPKIKKTDGQKRQERFEKLHDKLWRSTKLGGLPISYQHHIEDLQRQATLVVLNTQEDIENLRDNSEKELFNEAEQLERFCRSVYNSDDKIKEDKIDLQKAMRDIATGKEVSPATRSILNEALAKSYVPEVDIVGPSPAPWKAS